MVLSQRRILLMLSVSDKVTKKHIFFIAAILILITVAAYENVWNHEFINFDDDIYVTDNQIVAEGLTLKGISWALGFNERGYWQPLTWLSHMLDCELYGLNPSGHHLTNLIIHLANILLLFWALYRMTGKVYRSALVAAFFALHPLNVDTVAWVAERKNLLSTFFWILSLLSYNRYAENPRPDRYILTLILFASGLMVKPMLVTLPFVLLLFDFWPLKRTRFYRPQGRKIETAQRESKALHQHTNLKQVAEKLPFFALSLVSLFLSILSAQHIGVMIAADTVPMGLRISNALVSYVEYIGKMIWPSNLAVYYPFPEMVPLGSVLLACTLLVAITGLFLYYYKKKPYLAVGWFWYLGTMIPVIGIVQGGLWPAMADRWTYVPLIGLFIIVSWGMTDIAAKWRQGKPALILIACSIIVFFAVTTRVQLQHWKNSIALFEHTLAVTKSNYVALNNLGNALAKEGNLAKAIVHYTEAIHLKPDYTEAYNNNGIALAKLGNVLDAIKSYSEAIRLDPGYAEAYNNLGALLTEQGHVEEAIQNYTKALVLKPDYAEAHNNMGVALKKQGQIPKAAQHYFSALLIDPNYAAPHYNLGIAFVQFGKIEKAIYHFRKALQIDPTYKNAREKLEIALNFQGLSTDMKLTNKELLQKESY